MLEPFVIFMFQTSFQSFQSTCKHGFVQYIGVPRWRRMTTRFAAILAIQIRDFRRLE